MKLSRHPVRALAILFAASLFAGCSSTVLDARGPSEICEIHHTFMRTVEFEGRPAGDLPDREYLAARTRLFRHSYPASLPRRFHTTYVIYLCDDCVRAEEKWRAEHEIPER